MFCNATGDGAAFGGKVVGASRTFIKMALGLSRYKNRKGARRIDSDFSCIVPPQPCDALTRVVASLCRRPQQQE